MVRCDGTMEGVLLKWGKMLYGIVILNWINNVHVNLREGCFFCLNRRESYGTGQVPVECPMGCTGNMELCRYTGNSNNKGLSTRVLRVDYFHHRTAPAPPVIDISTIRESRLTVHFLFVPACII